MDQTKGEGAGACAVAGAATAAGMAADTEAYRALAASLALDLARALAGVLDLDSGPVPDWRGLRALAREVRAAADRALLPDRAAAPGSPDCWVPR